MLYGQQTRKNDNLLTEDRLIYLENAMSLLNKRLLTSEEKNEALQAQVNSLQGKFYLFFFYTLNALYY